MCTSCFGPTSTTYGYFAVDQTQANTTSPTTNSVTSLFCSVLPLIITTASTLAFILTGHPLALFGALVGGIWLIASIAYEDAKAQPAARAFVPHHTHTTTYVIPPVPAPVPQSVVYMTPPQAVPQPPVVQIAPPQTTNFSSLPSMYSRPSIRSRDVPTVEVIETMPVQQAQSRAPVRNRPRDYSYTDDTTAPRVASMGNRIITTDQAQERTPVGQRREEDTTPTSIGGRAQIGRRGQ
jgi:hypothetical protein